VRCSNGNDHIALLQGVWEERARRRDSAINVDDVINGECHPTRISQLKWARKEDSVSNIHAASSYMFFQSDLSANFSSFHVKDL
jgi:hypothetical protein